MAEMGSHAGQFAAVVICMPASTLNPLTGTTVKSASVLLVLLDAVVCVASSTLRMLWSGADLNVLEKIASAGEKMPASGGRTGGRSTGTVRFMVGGSSRSGATEEPEHCAIHGAKSSA
jgi:hypothetical protein